MLDESISEFIRTAIAESVYCLRLSNPAHVAERITEVLPMHETTSNASMLTVGLPVYNGETFIRVALDSILSQSFSSFAVVISDNASTDATEEICRDYAATDSRISYHRQPRNMGGAWNFNRLVERCDTPYFKWMSHDDVTGEGFLESCMTQFETAPEDVVLCYPRTILIDGVGEPIGEFDDNLDLRQNSPHERLRGYLDNYRMSNALFGVLRTRLLRRTALHGAYSSADKVFMAELALVGQFWELPERLFFRRYHEGMSRRANVTPHEVASWFDPINPNPVLMERTKLFAEYSKAITSPRLGLPIAERALALRELAAAGGTHELRVIAGEMKRGMKANIVRYGRRLQDRMSEPS